MPKYITFSALERAGRLGNQLWQIAATLGLARKHGLEPRFPKWSYRPYFSVPDEYFQPIPPGEPCIESPTLVTWMDPRTVTYLQDVSLFADVADEVRAIFKPSPIARERMDRLGRPTNPLVVHVRRGDNVTQPDHYPMPSLRYYSSLINTCPVRPVEIFSDDFRWCSDVLLSEIRKFSDQSVRVYQGVPRPKEHEPNYWTVEPLDWLDLLLMADAGPDAAFVISNSTFSWWGAWLSGSKDIVYPKPWYGKMMDVRQQGYCDASLMFPANWREVDAA
jgi:hypothetical protein